MPVNWKYEVNNDHLYARVFTPAQLQVLCGLANGLDYKAIAKERERAVDTVKNLVAGINRNVFEDGDMKMTASMLGLFGVYEELSDGRERDVAGLVCWAIAHRVLVETEY